MYRKNQNNKRNKKSDKSRKTYQKYGKFSKKNTRIKEQYISKKKILKKCKKAPNGSI